jgi:diaminopimelate decarboxylase
MIFYEAFSVLDKQHPDDAYFLYDLDGLREHASLLAQGPARIFFACKANPLSAILSVLAESQISFDVASMGELQQINALPTPISGDRIIMTGPAKPEKLIQMGLRAKVGTFVVESLNQLKTIQEHAGSFGYEPKILLRLQIAWENSTESSVLGGSSVTPFGVDLVNAEKILEHLQLPFLGFHVFQWGNILSAEHLYRIWEKTIQICKSLVSQFEVVDLGGGLGIPYKHDEQSLNWQQIAQNIVQLKKTYNIPQIWLEMGRYMTGPYGQYFTSVVDIKQTYHREMVVLESGVNHLARSALVQQAFPAALLRKSQAKTKNFFLHGPLCTALDFLGEHMLPEDIRLKDRVVFMQTGAYGFTESMPYFLCHPLAGEAVIENKSLKIIRTAQSPTIWMK